jgi:hypothetical protein
MEDNIKELSDKIIGVWENAAIKYCFYDDKSMYIIWVKNHNKNEGDYSIIKETILEQGEYVEIDVIVFKYGYNRTSYWKGRIVNITEDELSIEDLSNDIGQIDTMFKENSLTAQAGKLVESVLKNKPNVKKKHISSHIKDNENNISLKSTKIGLTKYIISRCLLVFFTLSTYEWISNIDKQVINFFNAYEGSFGYYLLVIILGIVAFSICALLIISVFSLLHASYKIGFENVLKKLNLKSIPKSIAISPFLFNQIFNDEVKIENEYKKNTIPFIAIALILVLFIGGSPLVNNYRAVYLNYEVYSDNNGNTSYKEKQTYVFDKDDTKLINSKINNLDNINYIEEWAEDVYDSDLDYYGTSRGYLFEQTALIEGFESYKKNTSGFFNYISCLIYFIIEKFIVTLIYFLVPFMVWIGISMYRNKN